VARLVFITQRVDPGDPVLAATVPKIRALAARVDDLTVIARRAAPADLRANVRVRTFDAPDKLRRGVRLTVALLDELTRRPRPQAVVAHMIPLYAIVAAPLARALGVRTLLWYTHWKAHLPLRLAERLVHAVLSVDRRSFPLPSGKLTPIGHGIEVDEFPCRSPGANGSLRLLALGRYSPAKGLDIVVRGLRQAVDRGVDAHLELHGIAGSPLEQSHRRELETLVRELDLGERVRLEGPVPRAELPTLFARADLLVNNMRAGAPDKVVYEASAGCLPVLASNPVFDELFAGLEPPLGFSRDSADELAARLEAFTALDAASRAELGRALRERVAQRHSAASWAEGVITAAHR
jgi:glycosyltransferase involved in cell wall biosynthesis